MKVNSKIYLIAFVNLLLLGGTYFFALPKMSGSLIALRQSHENQILQLQELNEQLKNLTRMNEDLRALEKAEIKPADFFTSDATLVNEIKSIEDSAAKVGVEITLSISGTADKAQAVSSASGLSQVPYQIVAKGSYPNVLKFLQYIENRFFIAPVNGLNIVGSDGGAPGKGEVSATVLSNFYIFK